MAGHYTYDQVADRIVAELGVPRPALSTLRAAAATAGRGTNQRVRVTAGMPRPLQGRVDRQVLFDATEIDTWLANHPARAVRRARAALAAAAPEDRQAAVDQARASGLSWAEVADAIAGAEGITRTRQWAQQLYGTSQTPQPAHDTVTEPADS
ncbi:hypothetical protein GCM10023328_47350 [Modestobacter marinus]|uniref:Uncharacterized protein n=1 Tax=Modestobacter marinus TaxID=477641 RepID=A0A846LWY5_9ACTN|nr:hypothetical protein [Modestobacter marinus]NIH70265.1 hypothetical protein [Modestobacter marinus]GGL85591.1 hypothetical protein GCM10011589_47510 [Modestobacter marinus]